MKERGFLQSFRNECICFVSDAVEEAAIGKENSATVDRLYPMPNSICIAISELRRRNFSVVWYIGE